MPPAALRSIPDVVGARVFRLVHGHNLVYNTCWEDPRLDREAMALGPNDRVLVITSAGCNSLDYLLDAPAHVYAVDMNPRQNALLELKIAGIRHLDHDTFFSIFGNGRHPKFREIYQDELRADMSPASRDFWDRHLQYFTSRRSFYFHGSCGYVARFCNFYIDKVARIRSAIERLVHATDTEQQCRIYHDEIRRSFWTPVMRRFVSSDTTLAMLGVPRPQRHQVETTFQGGMAAFIEHCIESVFTRLPMVDNYFWRVYLTGSYSPTCCPEYLKPHSFARLRAGLVDRITVTTTTVEKFLNDHPVEISRFVLLDHMDWLSAKFPAALASEWRAILHRATPDARILFRSGGTRVTYLDDLLVPYGGTGRRLGDVLQYDVATAMRLHERDRVHTYGSFHIANVAN